MTLDILYLAWNRLSFTELTFNTMLANTDWSLVDKLVVLDDTSTDGTFEFLLEAVKDSPVPTVLDRKECRSPVMMMNEYLHHTDSDWFVKVDNDVMLPPEWLPSMLSVVNRFPELDLLGMEAAMGGRPDPEHWDGVYGFEESAHIGGVGLMQTQCFRRCGQIGADGRFGFGHYQETHDLKRGWIVPSLRVALLDRMPIEPWLSLSAEYRERRWQRRWPTYDPKWPVWWDWFTEREEEAA